MKQSLYIVAIQVLNVLISLFTTIYIAVNVEPTIYSLLIVYQVVISIFASFTSIGYETILIRNALAWKARSPTKINYFVSMSLYFRVIISFILLLPSIIYLKYISNSNYQGDLFLTLLLINFSALFVSLNNWLGLVLKGMNQYLLSFLIISLGAILTKLVGLLFYLKFGFEAFILVLIIAPAVIFIGAFHRVSRYVDKVSFSWSRIRFAKRHLRFGIIGYQKFLLGYSDRLLVTLILKPEIQAAYGLIKQFQEIGKTFIEGFFDPISQKIIQHKSNQTAFDNYMKKVFKINAIAASLVISSLPVAIFYLRDLITYIGFDKYPFAHEYTLYAIAAFVFSLTGKTITNFVNYFEKPRNLIFIDFFGFTVSSFTIVLFAIQNIDQHIYANRMMMEGGLFCAYFCLWFFHSKNYALSRHL